MSTELSRPLKVATVWLVAGMLVFLGVQWWQQRALAARFVVLDGGTVELARGPDGHWHWPGRVNGRRVDFLVDTGATGTAIPSALARDLGLEAIGRVQSMTAAGPTTGEVVRADIELDGGVRIERQRVVALPGLGPNPLLGMDVLGKLRWSQQGGVLRIELRPPP